VDRARPDCRQYANRARIRFSTSGALFAALEYVMKTMNVERSAAESRPRFLGRTLKMGRRTCEPSAGFLPLQVFQAAGLRRWYCAVLMCLAFWMPQRAIAGVQFEEIALEFESHKESHLLVRCTGEAVVVVNVLEKADYVVITVEEEERLFEHSFRASNIEHIDVEVPEAKLASLNYQMHASVSKLLVPRSITYSGGPGIDTIHINADYNDAGQTVELWNRFSVDLSTYAAPDHVNIDVARVPRMVHSR